MLTAGQSSRAFSSLTFSAATPKSVTHQGSPGTPATRNPFLPRHTPSQVPRGSSPERQSSLQTASSLTSQGSQVQQLPSALYSPTLCALSEENVGGAAGLHSRAPRITRSLSIRPLSFGCLGEELSPQSRAHSLQAPALIQGRVVPIKNESLAR